MKNLILSFMLLIFSFLFPNNSTLSQTGPETYVWPKDPKVMGNLKNWQGCKFGILIHFGLYSQLGTVESWGLCPEDWIERPGYDDYYKYVSDYRNTRTKFNPVNFDPVKWTKAIRNAGAKYIIYTAKHHDGFCMFDSKYTDFKITDKSTTFSSNSKSNTVKEVFQAARQEGLLVGAYFSKPDWNTPYFWWPYYPPKDRNPSYNIMKHPDRWSKYVNFTQNQIQEIVSDYGKIDILWLDGCWVRPFSTIIKNVEEFCKYPYDLDINMERIADNARKEQPGMLIVDRWVQGEFENYLTPEQKIPEKALNVPWESCITMGNAWGWVPNDKYKSKRELVQTLIKVVSKGGNLLLGIGPNSGGEFEPAVYERLKDIGDWIKRYGEAIYETTPVEPYQDGKIAYTAKNENTFYAIYMPDKDEKELPEELFIKTKFRGNIITSMIDPKRTLDSKLSDGLIKITIPKNLRTKLANEEAVVIKICK